MAPRPEPVHPEHDAVAAVVRGWFITSTPQIDIRIEPRWFGFTTDPEGRIGPRVVLTLDRPDRVGEALAEIGALYPAQVVEVYVDDRHRAAMLTGALVAAGCPAVLDTTFLALVGPLAAHPGPPGLSVERVETEALGAWARVKLQGFADTEQPPDPASVADEVGRRLAEAPVSRYDLARLDGEPVGVLGHHTGSDQLVFNLATRVPYRHRGIGQALLGRWAARAQTEGCRSLLINADDGGPAAALYRRMGFTDEVYWRRQYRLEIPLPR